MSQTSADPINAEPIRVEPIRVEPIRVEPIRVEPARARRFLILGICCLSLFIVGIDTTIVNVALPSIQRGLSASVSGLQWTIDAYTLVLASLLILSGRAPTGSGGGKCSSSGSSCSRSAPCCAAWRSAWAG